MSDTIIIVENLSKSYLIRHQQSERYTALRDVLTNGVKDMGRRLLGRANGTGPTQEEFWALKDVSFEACPERGRRVKRGERYCGLCRGGAIYRYASQAVCPGDAGKAGFEGLV
jgi:lipopolysaccharide transport system ATP-binding protein